MAHWRGNRVGEALLGAVLVFALMPSATAKVEKPKLEDCEPTRTPAYQRAEAVRKRAGVLTKQHTDCMVGPPGGKCGTIRKHLRETWREHTALWKEAYAWAMECHARNSARQTQWNAQRKADRIRAKLARVTKTINDDYSRAADLGLKLRRGPRHGPRNRRLESLSRVKLVLDKARELVEARDVVKNVTSRETIEESLRAVYEAYGDYGLRDEADATRDLTRDLWAERDSLKDLRPPTMSLGDLVDTTHMAAFMREVEPSLEPLGQLSTMYDIRAKDLRDLARDAAAKSETANRAYTFLTSGEAIALGIGQGQGITSSIAAKYVADAIQFRNLADRLDLYAETANRLAGRYEKNAERARDYKGFLDGFWQGWPKEP